MSFLVVAVAIGRLTADTAPIASTDEAVTGVWAGWRATAEHPPLRTMMAIEGFAQLAQGGFVVLFVVFVVDALGDDGAGVGIIRGTMAIGGLTGAALIGRLAGRIDPTVLFGLGLVGMGVVSLVFWNSPRLTTDIWFYVVVFSMSGIPGAAMGVGFLTTIQTVSPPHIIGRVVGVVMAYDAFGTALGSILAGLLVDRVALTSLLDAQAAIYLVAGVLVFALVSPAERSRRQRPAHVGPRRRGGSRSFAHRP